MYSIYCITNKINGKKYVGMTSRKVDARWKKHVRDSKQESHSMYSSPLQADIRKYGETCFTHEVLVTTEDKELAMRLEDEATLILNTHVPNGYNRMVGYHSEYTEETKKKMSESKSGENHPMYGKHHSDKTKMLLSEINTGLHAGEKNHMYGKHHSEEAKRKMREKRNKPVVCIETGVVFESCKVASEWAGLKNGRGAVSACCNGKQKTAGGYHWEYVDDKK